MTGRQCKHCKIIKTLSGPKYWCKKHEKKCPCRPYLKCLSFESKNKITINL